MYIGKKYFIKGNINYIYDFFSNANLWKTNTEHCENILIIEESIDGEISRDKFKLLLDKGEDIITERVKSINRYITYNQTFLPEEFYQHSGSWEFLKKENGCIIVSHHIIAMKELKLFEKKYNNNSLESIENIVRKNILHNSDELVNGCKRYLKEKKIC